MAHQLKDAVARVRPRLFLEVPAHCLQLVPPGGDGAQPGRVYARHAQRRLAVYGATSREDASQGTGDGQVMLEGGHDLLEHQVEGVGKAAEAGQLQLPCDGVVEAGVVANDADDLRRNIHLVLGQGVANGSSCFLRRGAVKQKVQHDGLATPGCDQAHRTRCAAKVQRGLIHHQRHALALQQLGDLSFEALDAAFESAHGGTAFRDRSACFLQPRRHPTWGAMQYVSHPVHGDHTDAAHHSHLLDGLGHQLGFLALCRDTGCALQQQVMHGALGAGGAVDLPLLLMHFAVEVSLPVGSLVSIERSIADEASDELRVVVRCFGRCAGVEAAIGEVVHQELPAFQPLAFRGAPALAARNASAGISGARHCSAGLGGPCCCNGRAFRSRRHLVVAPKIEVLVAGQLGRVGGAGGADLRTYIFSTARE